MEIKDYFAIKSQCKNCNNYILNFTCFAFTEKIPEDVYINKIIHSKPLPGQNNNIVFEPGEPNQN